MNGRFIKFTILVSVLIFSSVQTPRADPGDIGDPIVATLGINNGNIALRAGNQYFSFTTTADQWYNFSLVGPEDTIFGINIYKAGSSTLLGSAWAWTYPNFLELGDLPSELLIHVESSEGNGDFTLTITEIEKPPVLEVISFSDEIIKDKVYTWDVHYFWDFKYVSTEWDGLHHGDNISMVWPVNGDDVNINFSDPTTFVALWIQVNGINITDAQSENVFHVFEATYFLFDDGSEMDLKEALIKRYAIYGWLDFSETEDEYVMGSTNVAEFGNISAYAYIDKTSGMVNLYSFIEYNNNEIEHQYMQTRIKDPSELQDDTTTTTTSVPTTPPVTTEPTEETTPIDPFWFAIPLMLIPVIRRKSRK